VYGPGMMIGWHIPGAQNGAREKFLATRLFSPRNREENAQDLIKDRRGGGLDAGELGW